MRRFYIVVLFLFPVLMLLSGCASTGSKEVGNLKNRVSALEERQDALEARSRAVSTDITYVSTVEKPVPTTVITTSKVSSATITKKDVQKALKRAGYYDGAIDGKIGPKTRKAITDFQADNKLKVDGIVGDQTKAALLKYLDK